MKELFVDTETTGLNPYKNGIVQIAFILNLRGTERLTFERKVKPLEKDAIDSKALEANGFTQEEIYNFTPAEAVYREMSSILNQYVDKFDKTDKFIFYGYNGRFDYDFLRTWFQKVANDKYFGSYIHFPPIDIMTLAIDHLKKERHTMSNFKQGTVAKKLGIEVDESMLHDAIYDIRLAKQIYEKVTINKKE